MTACSRARNVVGHRIVGQRAAGHVDRVGVAAGVFERLGQTEEHGRVGRALAQGGLAQLAGLGQPTGRGEQADGVGGERAVGVVVTVHHVQCPQHQVGRGTGRPHGVLLSQVPQHADRLPVGGVAAAQQVLGQFDRVTILADHVSHRLVQAGPHRAGQPVVDGLPHQVVTEAELIVVDDQDPRRHDLVDRGEHLGRGYAHQPGRGGDRERASEHRPGLQQP